MPRGVVAKVVTDKTRGKSVRRTRFYKGEVPRPNHCTPSTPAHEDDSETGKSRYEHRPTNTEAADEDIMVTVAVAGLVNSVTVGVTVDVAGAVKCQYRSYMKTAMLKSAPSLQVL
jgi:hypothetical protein